MDNLQKLEKAVSSAEAELERLHAKKAAVLAGLGSEAPSEKTRGELIGFQVDEQIAEARIKAALKDLRSHFEAEVDAELDALPAREAALDEGVKAGWREAGKLVTGGLRILKQMGPPASRLVEWTERGVSSLGESEAPLWAAGASEAALLPEHPDLHSELSLVRALQNLKRDRGLRSMRVNSKFNGALAKIRERNEK